MSHCQEIIIQFWHYYDKLQTKYNCRYENNTITRKSLEL